MPVLDKAQLPVVVETKQGRSKPVNLTILRSASVTAIEPDVAMPGEAVLIRGEGFSGQNVSVQIAGVASPSVKEAPEGVRAVVPPLPLPEGSSTTVVVQAGSKPERSFPLIIGRLPLVLALKPPRGAVGQTVVIDGRGFETVAHANQVAFGGQRALRAFGDGDRAHGGRARRHRRARSSRTSR